jgi:hypothetical protein
MRSVLPGASMLSRSRSRAKLMVLSLVRSIEKRLEVSREISS